MANPNPELQAARERCANEVAADLYDLERFIEQSLAKTAGVVARLAADREPLGLSVLHGQRLFNDALQLAASLNGAREIAGELHKTAALTQRQLGVRLSTGNPSDKPDPGDDLMPKMATPDPVGLRRVA